MRWKAAICTRAINVAEKCDPRNVPVSRNFPRFCASSRCATVSKFCADIFHSILLNSHLIFLSRFRSTAFNMVTIKHHAKETVNTSEHIRWMFVWYVRLCGENVVVATVSREYRSKTHVRGKWCDRDWSRLFLCVPRQLGYNLIGVTVHTGAQHTGNADGGHLL